MSKAVVASVQTLNLTDAVRGQLQRACGIIAEHLEERLHAIHLYGSAVAGGLRPLSDLDLLVTSETSLPERIRAALMNDLLKVSSPPGVNARHALEVTVVARDELKPWRHPARRVLQFGEWLRQDIESGRIEPPLLDHDLALLLTQVRQHGVTLFGPPAQTVFDPVPAEDVRMALADALRLWNVPEDWQGDERNVILTLVRIWYSARTGEIAAKDVAAEWAGVRLPSEHAATIAAARVAYIKGEEQCDRVECGAASFIHYLKPIVQQALVSMGR